MMCFKYPAIFGNKTRRGRQNPMQGAKYVIELHLSLTFLFCEYEFELKQVDFKFERERNWAGGG